MAALIAILLCDLGAALACAAIVWPQARPARARVRR